MRNVQAPQLLTDLYRDLRDRRLLLPAIVLVVALIAVPMALSSSATPTSTAPVTARDAGESRQQTAAEPAVLTRQLGVTAYRKRLQRNQTKNPFRQQFTLPEVTSELGQSSVTEPVTEPVDGTTGVTTSGGGSTSASSITEPSASSSSPDAGTPTSSSGPSGVPEPTLYAFQADLAIGPPGDVSRRKHVELGKLLPSKEKPIIAFVGATQDMKHGLFLVSADVSSVDGDGRCVPGPDNCSLLRLKVGDEAELAYAPESDRTYRLRLHGVGLAPLKAKALEKRGKRGSDVAIAAQG
jgi:hypothetical protein